MSDWKDTLLDKGEEDSRFRPYVWNAIDCGDGWRPLVEAFYALVEQNPCMRVAQVKEKYGGLRLYWDHNEEHCTHTKWVSVDEREPDPDGHFRRLMGVTDGLDHASNFMCESCGQYGRARRGGWIKTLCDDHAEGREAFPDA